jgi:sensor c-di-GMP phosphodiesterase-like protein
VFGILLGYAAGRFTILRLTDDLLSRNVDRVARDADRSLAESRAVLSAMNASPYKACEEQELVYFRALLFESKHLRDVGRMEDAHLACSAALGRPAQTRPLPQPDFLLPDGVSIYRNLGVYREDGTDDAVLTLRLNDSFVVFRSDNRMQPGPEQIHLAETVVDAPGHRAGLLRGEPLDVGIAILTTDNQTRVGNTFYATRCSASGLTCITGAVSISEAIKGNQQELWIFTALGGLNCGLVGMLLSIFYRRSRGLEQQLRRAIRKDRICVVYQPVVDLQSRRIVGAEALARWTDEDGFAIRPEVFVKLAEERGFVTEITRCVLRRCLREFAEILRGTPGFRININVTAADLADSAFLPWLASTLEEAAIPTQHLGIEITESSTARQQIAIDSILQMRRRGHRVYIDDFGTGYSSQAYLQDLAIDAIKIDRSFTRAIGTEAVTASILPLILSVAEALNLQVVVEGIETVEQAHYFTDENKRFLAQGWLFGRPLQPDQFRRLLLEDQKAASISTL